MSDISSIRVVKSTYYSNWVDRIGYPLARFLAGPLSKLSFVTPNKVTLSAFAIFTLGCIFLVVSFPYHMIAGAVLIFAGYIGDCIDGQLARIRGVSSIIGDYIDKALDVLKIFFVTFFSGLSVYLTTGNILYLLLGFVACFFFNFRYYILHESMISVLYRDEKFLEKSVKIRKEMEKEMDSIYMRRAKSFKEAIQIFWIKNRTIFFVDEAEFALFVSLGAILNKLDFSLWILAVSQVVLVFWRLIERGGQLHKNSKSLLLPMRK